MLTRLLTAAMIVAGGSMIAIAPATAQDKVRLRLASALSGSVPLVGAAGKRIAKLVTEITDGNVDIRFFEPGALVPALEVFDAVSQGSIDAGWHAGGYIAGKVPAAPLFVGVPFGPKVEEYLAWYEFGGGKQLHERIYGAYNVKPIICATLAPEAAGWFRREITSVEDLKGLKFRIAGPGGKALERLGGSAQLLPPGEIYQSLERGLIDGTENSSPAIDLSAGYYKIAPNYYFPGWHQPVAVWELLINKARWNALSPLRQKQIESACRDNIQYSIAEGEAAQLPAIATLKANGVKFRRLPDAVLQALEKEFNVVIAEMAAANADVKAVWDSMTAFRKTYAEWNALK